MTELLAGSNSSSSQSLIRRAQSEDKDAWRRITHLYGPTIYGWARRAGLQPSDAADVTQTVFQALIGSLKNFRREPQNRFRGWLWGITQHKIVDFYRANGKVLDEAIGGSAAQAMINNTVSPELSASVSSDEPAVYRRMLEQMRVRTSERVWTAFFRTAIRGDDPGDVAQDLGMTVWAVYKARARVLKRLRDEFGDLI